jgi:CDP-paratose 2-epimerase
MRLAVTGGAGFIGSNLCIQLKERHPAWELVALDNLYRRGSELNVRRLLDHEVEFVHADVRRAEDLEAAGDFEAMVECSAEPSVSAHRAVVVPVNLIGAYHCFESAASRGAQVIFLSTSRVYPIAELESLRLEEGATRFELLSDQMSRGASERGITEDFPIAGPRTMYGATKLAAELLLAEYDVPWTVNRCGVVAGPWQLGKVDQGVFTHWMLCHHFERPLSYIGYGGSGKQVRDLLHVNDLVDLVEEQLMDPEHWSGCTFNVGGGLDGSLSLLEATQICRELSGNAPPVTSEVASRPGDVPWYISDCSALFAHTDWRPKRLPQQILGDVSGWITEHHDLVSSTL